jgi:hypothetical protein
MPKSHHCSQDDERTYALRASVARAVDLCKRAEVAQHIADTICEKPGSPGRL